MEKYKERMKKEYEQLDIKVCKLEKIICNYHCDNLDFELNCPIEILETQLNIMKSYLSILKYRALLENIDLE